MNFSTLGWLTVVISAREPGSIPSQFAFTLALTNPMRKSKKGIITCAVTSATHTLFMSPYLPISGQEIADAAIGAAKASAAIVYLHCASWMTAHITFLKTIKKLSFYFSWLVK